jgi:cytochrome P450
MGLSSRNGMAMELHSTINMGIILIMYQQIRQSVKAVYDNPYGCLFNGSRKSMLSTILASDKAPKEEKDFERLAQEMTFIMVAGTDAPSQVMAITMFHILRSPDIHQKLKAELNDAFPVPVSNADWDKLEHLPYLVRNVN